MEWKSVANCSENSLIVVKILCKRLFLGTWKSRRKANTHSFSRGVKAKV